MSQYQTIPIITTLPHLIRSDDSLCQWQKAVVIAPPASKEAFLCPPSDCLLPDSIDIDLDSHRTLTVSLPSDNPSESWEYEPDLSVVKSEDGSGPVCYLNLKDVIDLSTDNEEEILILPQNPTPVQPKDNIEKAAQQIPLILQKDHSEKVTAKELEDHCEQITYIHYNESSGQNGRDEMESSDSHHQIDENPTIFSYVVNQASPSECHQTSSHVPVDPLPVLHQSPSESAKSPTDIHLASPHITSSKAQQVIAKIKSWTNSEVHDWLKSHHMDKICPNLATLDGEGLQRMALQYMHDSDSFYTSVKRRLGLSVFQTLVICRSMKELTDI